MYIPNPMFVPVSQANQLFEDLTPPPERRLLRPIENIQHNEDINEDEILFEKPSNLMSHFRKCLKGRLILNQMNNENFVFDEDYKWKIVNFMVDLLVEENDQKLNFGTNKVQVLYNVAGTGP